MVRQINLSEFNSPKAMLLAIVGKKIALGKTSLINADLNGKLKIDLNTLSDLLNSIECKMRECEIIFHTYLENADHSVLCGNGKSLPITADIEFSYSTNIFKKSIEINDKNFYKEIVDINFRHFILLIATIFENIVFLTELLLKKVILHLPDKKPISAPLHDFVSFLKTLINLGYRKNDDMNKCITSHNSFFEKYLQTINHLRNRFMHGFIANLESDGASYRIGNFLSPFTKSSPELDIDVFSGNILIESRSFLLAILTALTKSIKHFGKSIPA